MSIEAPGLARSPVMSTLPNIHERRPALDLFLISFVILFFELTCIRWFGSTVIFLTFFTNIVLLASFLGMSVGCLAAPKDRNLIDRVIPVAMWTVFLACAVLLAYSTYYERIVVGLEGQKSPQQIFFGTEFRPKDPSHFVIPIEAVAGLFFVLIAMMFVGLGQALGRALGAIPDRITAYSIDIVGSLSGIAAFGVASYFHTTPLVWFSISIGIIFYLSRNYSLNRALYTITLLFLVGLLSDGITHNGEKIYWSPYYKVMYTPEKGMIATNNIGHQAMVKVSEAGPAYVLPHLLNRDAGGRPFEDVLIIGAGSGNDVQAALAHGAKHVDAVEIDPVLNAIGRGAHPDRPYDDPRVSVHLDDGRSFVRKTKKTYDLVSYAVVDSLVLHSGYSSLRLESFLFTEQALRDVKAKLKPGGVFAMYNYYRRGWVVGRLEKLAEKVFGTKPLVVSLPYQERITSEYNQENHITFILVANTDSSAVETIRRKLDESGSFWVNEVPRYNEPINAFGPSRPIVADAKPADWQRIAPTFVDTADIGLLPTDDWPFLYLREPSIPALSLRGMLLIAVLSVAILFRYAPVRTMRPNAQMFFLGAGFMLLETKGVVHMALLFGSTWVVNSIVFFSILVMILLGNLYVIAFKPKQSWPFYGLLIAALIVNVYVPMDDFLSLPGVFKVLASCAVVFIPVFFAGIIFATAFRDSRNPDVDFGSNIGGVIVGGLSEYFSLMLGFNHLLLIAIAFYLLSAVFRPRLRSIPALTAAIGNV